MGSHCMLLPVFIVIVMLSTCILLRKVVKYLMKFWMNINRTWRKCIDIKI